jgi:spore coat protein U-like protein
MPAKHLWYIPGLALAALLAVPHEATGVCVFNSTVGVSFGAYNVFNTTPTDSTGSITYTCSSVFTITIHLSRGSAPSYFPRQMRKGAESLPYNLYRDAARTSVWGDGTGGTSRYGPVFPPFDRPVTVTVYGRIPARQNVSAGSYTDTITATINF